MTGQCNEHRALRWPVPLTGRSVRQALMDFRTPRTGLTVKEAAHRLSLSEIRVSWMVAENYLESHIDPWDGANLITAESVEKEVRWRRRAGPVRRFLRGFRRALIELLGW